MYRLNRDLFYGALKKSRFRTVSGLAQHLGVHRNTIAYYLTGKPVISESLEKILEAVALELADCIDHTTALAQLPQAPIASVIDQLHEKFPGVLFLLFGSRARGKSSKYADYDIGAYRAAGLPHDEFRRLHRYVDELQESLPCFIDITNLNRVDALFLNHIKRDWIFLTGRQADWIALQKEAA